MTIKFKLKDGSIIPAEKDCDCLIHDGPCWLHMDELLEGMNKKYFNPEKPTFLGFLALATEESARLRQKLYEMESRGIVEIIREEKKMQMITTGNVTLPDGREVHAVERWEYEYMDGRPFSTNHISIEIEWLDGTPLEAHEYNETVSPNQYLHEFVGEQLALTGKTEEDSYDPL